MVMAVVGTLFHHDIVTYRWIAIGLAIGTVVGGGMGLWVPMTAVPQRTALSHSWARSPPPSSGSPSTSGTTAPSTGS